MPPHSVRLLNADDASAFRALRLQALLAAPQAFGASPEEESALPLAQLAHRLTPGPGQAVFGHGAPLDSCIGLLRQCSLKQAHKALIWGMYVAPALRGNGLGRALLQAAIARAETMPGLQQLHLSVTQGNTAALRLYQRLGFEAYGCEPAALRVHGRDLDEILMVRRLHGA